MEIVPNNWHSDWLTDWLMWMVTSKATTQQTVWMLESVKQGEGSIRGILLTLQQPHDRCSRWNISFHVARKKRIQCSPPMLIGAAAAATRTELAHLFFSWSQFFFFFSDDIDGPIYSRCCLVHRCIWWGRNSEKKVAQKKSTFCKQRTDDWLALKYHGVIGPAHIFFVMAE